MSFTEFFCDSSTGSNLNAGSTTAASVGNYVSGSWVSTTRIFTIPGGGTAPNSIIAVGDFVSIYLDAATTTAYVARVTNVSATTVTTSATVLSGTLPTTGSGFSLKAGGPWKGPNAADGFPLNFINAALVNVAGNRPRVNLKNNATYSVTAGITTAANLQVLYQGYTGSPNDGGKATIDGGTTGASYTVLTLGSSVSFADLIFQNNGSTGSAAGIAGASRTFFERCVISGMVGFGISNASNMVECEIYGCNTSNTTVLGGASCTNSTFLRCHFHDNAGSNSSGVVANITGAVATFVQCVFANNGQHGINFTASNAIMIVNCDFYNNGSAGINISATEFGRIENCNFVKNGTYGIDFNTANQGSIGSMFNCGYGSGTQQNSSGQTHNQTFIESGAVTYAANITPWVAPTTGDFRIDKAAAMNVGRGAFTQTYTGSTYTGHVAYPDIGSGLHRHTGTKKGIHSGGLL